MTAFAVFRVEKLKTQEAVAGALGHDIRTNPPPHADPKRGIEVWRAPADDMEPVADRIRRLTGKPPRSNGVLATAVLITASPEYFRPDDPDAKGTWDDDRLQAWTDALRPWIEEKFPHAISISLHLDEDTPHIQIIDLPLVDDPKTGGLKLSHKVKYGGNDRKDIKRWQQWAAEPVKHLGIKRGIERSGGKHVDPGQWRNDVAGQVQMPPVSPPPKFIVSDAKAKEWAEKETRRIVREMTPSVRALRDRGQGAEILKRQAKAAATKAVALREENERLREENQRRRDELLRQTERMREIPLVQVFDDWGLHPDPKDPKWNFSGFGHRVSTDRRDPQKWYDHDRQVGGYGAIDLVMHLDQVEFREAIATMRGIYGDERTTGHVASLAPRLVADSPDPAPYQHPGRADDADANSRLRHWLTRGRGLSTDLASWLIEKGRCYAARHGRWLNAVWPAQESAEMRGVDGSFKAMAPGSKKSAGGWSIRTGTGPVQDLVICESALDAASYADLHRADGRSRLLVSTAGCVSEPPTWLLKLTSEAQRSVVAYDADEAGDSYGERLVESLAAAGVSAGRHRPDIEGADWNEILQRQRKDGDDLPPMPSPAPAGGGSGPSL